MKKDEISDGLAEVGHAGSCQITQNDAGTCGESGTKLTQRRSGPVRYEVVAMNGTRRGNFETANAAAWWARDVWPDQSQDPDRTGKGWDVQVVGAE